MAWGSFGLVLAGNLTLTEVAPFVNQIRDLLKLISPQVTITLRVPETVKF
jgi:hypothetical protein